MLHFSCARKRRCVGVERCRNKIVWVELVGHARHWQLSGQGQSLPGKRKSWRRAKLAMSIHDAQIVHRSLDVPEYFKEADIEAQVALTLPSLFPGGLAAASDFYRVEEARLELYACPQVLIEEYQQWAQGQALRLEILEPESLALCRAYQHSSQAQRRSLLVHARGEQLSALLVGGEQVIFQRSIDLRAVSEQAALEGLLLSLEACEFEQILISGQLPMSFQHGLSAGLACSVDEFEYGEFAVALGLAIGVMYAPY